MSANAGVEYRSDCASSVEYRSDRASGVEYRSDCASGVEYRSDCASGVEYRSDCASGGVNARARVEAAFVARSAAVTPPCRQTAAATVWDSGSGEVIRQLLSGTAGQVRSYSSYCLGQRDR